MKYSFRNDYNQVGHPLILEALVKNASAINVGYGFDDISINLEKKIQKLVKEKVSVYLLAGGTQTNMLTLSKILKPYEAVISVKSGHIESHETGAVEGSGHKIITVNGENGKVRAGDVLDVLALYNNPHMVKPRAVYISDSTEIGTVYKKEELKELYKVCKKNDLYLFLDGARLPIALTSSDNDMDLADICKYTDAFYIGGTKNGMPLGEMLIIKDKYISEDFRYHLKNKGAMLSKTFMLAYMFDAYFENDLYLSLAKNSNSMAKYLREELHGIGIEIAFPNNTNQVFVILKNDLINTIKEEFDFEMWEEGKESSIIRLVTSFNTSKDSIDALIEKVK